MSEHSKLSNEMFHLRAYELCLRLLAMTNFRLTTEIIVGVLFINRSCIQTLMPQFGVN